MFIVMRRQESCTCRKFFPFQHYFRRITFRLFEKLFPRFKEFLFQSTVCHVNVHANQIQSLPISQSIPIRIIGMVDIFSLIIIMGIAYCFILYFCGSIIYSRNIRTRDGSSIFFFYIKKRIISISGLGSLQWRFSRSK